MRTFLPLFFGSFVLAACSSSSSGGAQPPADTGTGGSDTGTTPTDGGGDVATDTGGGDAGDPLAAERAACTFEAGAKVADTLGVQAADRAKIPISHVIIVMKENRSYDHYFGQLAKERTDVEAVPDSYSNPDNAGAIVKPAHETNSCLGLDPDHQWDNVHVMWDNGKLDGFVKNAQANTRGPDDKTLVTTDGHFVLNYRERADIPFYYWLTDTYAMADQFHCSALSGTWTNRLYMLAGSSYGVKNTGSDVPPAGIKTLMDEMDTAGVTWGAYTDDGIPFDFALLTEGYDSSHKGVGPTSDFYTKLADGSLPQVTFIDGRENIEDEHPPADIEVGEAWTKKIYDAVVKSPLWLGSDGKGVAMIWTFDEAGGFSDHVNPPSACVASPDQTEFDRLGLRVPFVMVSPFAKTKFVTHHVYEHASITRFVETLFDLPALTARDANADVFMELFDFTRVPVKTPPTPPDPATGGCTPG